ncbi:MAG: ATP synthase F1 subunit delta, partial [Bacteroidota bacterium]
MKNLRVAGRYAKSLIDLAIERNQLEEVNKDMETLRELVKVRDFALLLKSPVVPPSKKKSILDTVLEGRVGEMMMGFVRILVNKGREKDLIDISDAFSDQYRAIKNISAVKVTSAKPVDATILQQIERQLVAAGKISKNGIAHVSGSSWRKRTSYGLLFQPAVNIIMDVTKA